MLRNNYWRIKLKRLKAKRQVRKNLERITDEKHRKPGKCNCQKCSRCCDRVIAVRDSEVKAVEKYLKDNPQLVKKIKNILRWVPENEDVCPFLDLTVDNNNRCLLYSTTVRFYICKIFSCYVGSSYGEDMENWREECKHSDDPAYNLDLRHHFFGAKENWANRYEAKASIFTDLFWGF